MDYSKMTVEQLFDEYYWDGVRLTSEQYPEFIMANYFIENGLCS